ncbi:hypothetical protein KAM339_013880 [Aeromonas caviae]|nr:hypothetical protein KAM339_013880 [Aeromonas caviae]
MVPSWRDQARGNSGSRDDRLTFSCQCHLGEQLHERLDGKGYPKGLKGEAITLETRIITTADIFDAITAKRPYRDAIPVPRALEMMAENLGTAIDPDCFAALKAGIEDFSLYLTPEQPLARAS